MSFQELQQKMYDILTSNKPYDYTKTVIENLIEQGADIHKPLTEKGEYAFHAINRRIFNYNNVDIRKISDYLLQHNCDINALDNDNKNPLYILCEEHTKNYTEKHKMIEYLLESGASPFSERNIDLLELLDDKLELGYNSCSDRFDTELETFLLEYTDIVDYCAYSSPNSFKYILRNTLINVRKIIDIKYILYKYAKNKIFKTIKEEYIYSNNLFDYKKAPWYVMDKEFIPIDFKRNTPIKMYDEKRNKAIFKYIDDAINYWSPSRHYIQPTCVRNAVWSILLTQHKINQIEDHPLFLPEELWFIICSFLRRDMWVVNTDDENSKLEFTRIRNLPCLL